MKESVTFKQGSYFLAGTLFLPDDFQDVQFYPALVISAPAGAVKEQSPSFYAERLVKHGFVVLVYDTSFQGESGGEPRNIENPTVRVEDVKCAVDYLTTLPYIDNDRIGAFGICSGGGYVFHAAMTDRRLKAIAGASISDPSAWIREGMSGEMTREAQLALLEEASQQRTREASGFDPIYGPFVPEEVTEDMPVTLQEANEYYRTPRAQHPRSENKVSMMSIDKLMVFDTFHFADYFLTQPILVIAGSQADTIGYSKKLIDKAASNQKELFVIEGATHVDLYDKVEFVDPAIEKIAEFYKTYLV